MTGRKVRTKKLNVKTPLLVLTEDQIDPTEYNALITETEINTGVDKGEENEFHLQNILKDAGTSNDQEIPVPPPQQSDIDYNSLYSARFSQPSTYIRFSNTVEESIGCPYDLTSEDVGFLKRYNGGQSPAARLLENDLELTLDVFENTAAESTPFSAVDNTIVGFECMLPALNQLGSAMIMQHAKAIYDYWSSRRKELGNKPLHPELKFEMQQEIDEMDPYVCFRRREARQTRKTRARDVSMAEKLKRLRRELEEGRQLVILSHQRETLKRELLASDRLVFEHRARLKALKVRLGLKGEEEDLFNQKKRKAAETPTNPRTPVHLRISVQNDGRAPEVDLHQLADKLAEKENEWRVEVEAKKLNHLKWNQNFTDLSRGPLSPVREQAMEFRFRPATTQYLMTPPASASSDSMDIDIADSPASDEEGSHAPVFRFCTMGRDAFGVAGPGLIGSRGRTIRGGEPPDRIYQPAFRRRIGRLNRLWIDRRVLATPKCEQEEYSDRWKYDQDDDEEPPVYEMDPFSLQSLRFRAMIPLPPSGYPRKPGSQNMHVEAFTNGSALHAPIQNGVRPVTLQTAARAAHA